MAPLLAESPAAAGDYQIQMR